jgi:hypothetical protein
MNSKTENEIKEELNYLYDKRNRYGWTQTEADRVKYLEKYV